MAPHEFADASSGASRVFETRLLLMIHEMNWSCLGGNGTHDLRFNGSVELDFHVQYFQSLDIARPSSHYVNLAPGLGGLGGAATDKFALTANRSPDKLRQMEK